VPPQPHPDRELIAAARAHAAMHLGRNGVVGVDVGRKYENKAATERVAIRFLVDKKLTPNRVRASDRHALPKFVNIAGRRVPTDVLQVHPKLDFIPTEPTEPGASKRRLDPVRPGCSIASFASDAGTLGMIVYDRDNGDRLGLGCWHVFDLGGGVESEIYQPGPMDLSISDGSFVGRLLRSHRGLAGDCAVISFDPDRQIDPSILELAVVPDRIGDPERSDLVVKSGRTTEVTWGRVDGIGLTLALPYDDGKKTIGGIFTIAVDPAFPNAIGKLADGGDSGSAWLAANPDGSPSTTALGLHIGSDKERPVAYACAMRPVMSKLRVLPAPPAP
jgi:endonuclease G